MTKDVSKWQPLVKAGREAPTLRLEREADVLKPTSSLAGLTGSLQPQSAMERDIQAMLQAAGAVSGSKVEAAEEALALKVHIGHACCSACGQSNDVSWGTAV